MKKKESKLLIPGWAGELSAEEAKQIQEALEKSPAKRRKWGITGKRLSSIAAAALPEDPEGARKALAKNLADARKHTPKPPKRTHLHS